MNKQLITTSQNSKIALSKSKSLLNIANEILGKKTSKELSESFKDFRFSPTLEHNESVNSVAITPDGKYIVSGSSDNTIKLWDINNGKVIRTFEGHKQSVNSVAITPDGKYIVSGSSDNTIKLWDINSGKEIRTFMEHKNAVYSVAISPDGKYIVSGSYDKTIKIWDIKIAECLKTLEGHSNYVDSVAISPDGKYIVSGSWDKTIKLWDINSGKEIRTFTGHKNAVYSVAISPDGKYIVSGSLRIIKLWEISTGKMLRSFSEKDDALVNTVVVSLNGKYIVSGCGGYEKDGTIKLWEISTGKMLRSFGEDFKSVNSVAISHDEKYIILGEGNSYIGNVKQLDISNGTQVQIFKNDIINKSITMEDSFNRYFLSTTKLWNTIDIENNIRIMLPINYTASINNNTIIIFNPNPDINIESIKINS